LATMGVCTIGILLSLFSSCSLANAPHSIYWVCR
jgi:hypothetical protein